MYILPELNADEIFIYLRKSRTDDAALTVAEVLEKHEQMLDEWVAQRLPEIGRIPEENRFREVVSGETLKDRPEVQKLLRKVESPKAKAILIVEPQRLSRGDLEDIGRMVKLLRHTNTIVITLTFTYDLRDPHDRDAFERELKRGNEFLEYQKRIMNNGRLLAVENGNFVGNYAPYGYRKVKIKEGKKYCHTLEPDPHEAPAVKVMFNLYAAGHGIAYIADQLDAIGFKPRKGGDHWSPYSLTRMLRNEHYLGKVVWNHRKTVTYVKEGEIVESRPVADSYLVYEGKHPALVSQETWDVVQARLGKNPRNTKHNNFSNPLAGLLYCAACGKAMSRRTYNKTAPRYLCDNQKRCKQASSLVDDLLAEVVKVLQEAIGDFEERIDAGEDESAEIHRQMVQRLEKRLEELDEREVKQWDEKTRGGMPQHIFDRLNAQLLEEREEVRQALCTAAGETPEPVDLEEKLITFQDALKALQDPEAPTREKNILLKECIERIEYRKERRGDGRGSGRWGTPEPMELTFKLRV